MPESKTPREIAADALREHIVETSTSGVRLGAESVINAMEKFVTDTRAELNELLEDIAQWNEDASRDADVD